MVYMRKSGHLCSGGAVTEVLHVHPRSATAIRPARTIFVVADQRVLVITGASTGIGAASARRAVEAGWRVVLAARSEDKLDDLSQELGGEERAVAKRCDVTDWEDQQALVATAVERFGRLDAFFANAGFGASRGFLEESVEHWKAMIDTNVYGVALSIRAALGHFREAGGGHMVLMSSVAGRRHLPGSLYGATKWAVTAMGESLRQEVSGEDIRVTLVEPGMVDTPFFDNRPSEALEADDIARAVVYALEQPPHVEVAETVIRPLRSG
jgi:NADP-dependent 3-hydroxy acid dehydrogenase YdfG